MKAKFPFYKVTGLFHGNIHLKVTRDFIIFINIGSENAMQWNKGSAFYWKCSCTCNCWFFFFRKMLLLVLLYYLLGSHISWDSINLVSCGDLISNLLKLESGFSCWSILLFLFVCGGFCNGIRLFTKSFMIILLSWYCVTPRCLFTLACIILHELTLIRAMLS